MRDFLIVGAGLAGISFAETAFINNNSFIVVNDESQNSSRVAGGIYNPVILKRFSLPLNAKEHLEYIGPFYGRIEQRLQVKFDYKMPVYRKFASVEEQNNWFQAADKPSLAPFLSATIRHSKYNGLEAPYGFGEVLNTGYMDIVTLLNAYQSFLQENNFLLKERFDYDALIVYEDHVVYKDISARHVVFAEGFGIHANPFFKDLPLDGTKGELLIIKAPNLKLDGVVNASIFLLPLGDDMYKIGATYEWYDKTPHPTEAGRIELIEKLEELISCPYEVIDHQAGIRPTVKDRKALIGTHPDYKNVHLLNGLGTRGVMLGPPMAKDLYDSIVKGTPVDKAVSLMRFKR